MERENYLVKKLTKEENVYLKKVILNTRKLYIRDNYNFINNTNVELSEMVDIEVESVLEAVINKCEQEIKSAIEFEKIVSSNRLYSVIKALSLKEKIVLFSLYKENKEINQIALEMKLTRKTIWKIKSQALDKIMKCLIGGGENV